MDLLCYLVVSSLQSLQVSASRHGIQARVCANYQNISCRAPQLERISVSTSIVVPPVGSRLCGLSLERTRGMPSRRRQSTPSNADVDNPLGRGVAAAMGGRRVVLEVQARDGRRLNIETALPGGECTPITTLKLTLPALAPSEAASPAASFLRLNRDPANLLLGYLAPESWLEVEQACRAGRVAVASSGCWTDKGVGDGQGKAVYVRQRRALHRVSRAFEDLRRFARFPASVFNPGATLADTMNAEQRTGVLFPDEVRASFILFDGQARSGWLRSEGVIGGFELLSLAESADLMLEEACFRGEAGPPPEFVPLANRRNSNEWLAAEVGGGRVCVIKPLSRPKVVASSWSHYLRVQ